MKLGTCIGFFAVSMPVLGVFALFAQETHLFAPKGPLETWQTLAAGLLAISAAFIGGRYITKQIEVTLALEADRTRRRFVAPRAVMPLTLSMFSAYARTTAAALRLICRRAVWNVARSQGRIWPRTTRKPRTGRGAAGSGIAGWVWDEVGTHTTSEKCPPSVRLPCARRCARLPA